MDGSIHVFNQEVLAAERQMDYLAGQLGKLESTMIDPQEFGALQAEVVGQRRDLDRIAQALDRFGAKLDAIEETLSTAQGGWKMLMLIGGAGAAAGGALSWFAAHVRIN